MVTRYGLEDLAKEAACNGKDRRLTIGCRQVLVAAFAADKAIVDEKSACTAVAEVTTE